MHKVSTVELKPGSNEELLPNFDQSYPHIISSVDFHKGYSTPWHWHKAVELFYVKSGTLEYTTPSQQHVFSAGSGGLVNSNVLHMAQGHLTGEAGCNYLHLFDPVLISGFQGSRMEEKYVLPLITAPQIELIALSPEEPLQAAILEKLWESFHISSEIPGYELRMRSLLSEIWVQLLELVSPLLEQENRNASGSEQIKQMMIYIHEHFGEKITVKDVADAACVSERTCFDLFRRNLRTTPVEYINSYRLRMACRLLAQTEDSVTQISAACGMNNSYFSQVFRESTGFTPLAYRRFYHRHQKSLNAQQIFEK